MSWADVRNRACGGKECFTSIALAFAVMRRRQKIKGRMNVYRCRICRAFHHGHQNVASYKQRYRR